MRGILKTRWVSFVIFVIFLGLSLIAVWGFSTLQNDSLIDETHGVALIAARQSEILFQGVSQGLHRLSLTIDVTDLPGHLDITDEYEVLDSIYMTDEYFNPLARYPSSSPDFNMKEQSDDPGRISSVIPIYDGSVLTGFLIGRMNLYQIIDTVFWDYRESFDLRLKKNGEVIHEAGSWEKGSYSPIFHETIRIDESLRFSAEVKPSGKRLAQELRTSFMVLFLCLALSLVIILLIRIAQSNQALSALNLKQYRELLENVDLAAFAIDLKGMVTFCNACLLSISGYGEEELLERSIFETLLSNMETGERHEWLENIAKKNVIRHREMKVVSKSGETRIFRLSSSLKWNTRDEVIGLSSIGEDITEQKQLEAENRELAEQFSLSQRIDSLGKLAGGIAHDFNNLLVPIIGYADMGLAEGASETILTYFSVIKEAGEKGASLTKQILAFSRKQIPRMQVVNLNDALMAFQPMLTRLIGENIEIQWEFSREEIIIRADQSQLEQILLNLSINARDAMERGGRLKISSFLDREGMGGFVVEDTGKGMTEEVKRHIFEPFYTTKPPESGTGLGLSTVFGILKQHEGTISVDTELGRGTTFTVKFYLVESEECEDVKAAADLKDLHGDEHIAIVEDNPQVLDLMRTVLESHGYTVETYFGPEEALSFLSNPENPAEIILSDVIMPGYSGFNMIKTIREKRPGIPTLFVSGYTNTELAKHAGPRGNLNILHKPFTAEILLRRVRETLDGRQS